MIDDQLDISRGELKARKFLLFRTVKLGGTVCRLTEDPDSSCLIATGIHNPKVVYKIEPYRFEKLKQRAQRKKR